MSTQASDEETDWEEVEVPEAERHIEITLQTGRKTKGNAGEAKKKGGISHAERLLRIDCHKIHTVCLLANAKLRNHRINDQLLHARLISLTPLSLQNAFAMIHKSRIPDAGQRGRLFETAITGLVEWWANEFFEVVPDGHIRNRTFNEVQNGLVAEGVLKTATINPDELLPSDEVEQKDIFSDPKVIDEVTLQDVLDDDGEPLRSVNSLMKRALVQKGSRDVSAQLFTALCRALAIPARLVVSLQSVPWQAGVGKPKPAYTRKKAANGKEKAVDEDDVMEDGMHTPNGLKYAGVGQRLDGHSPQTDDTKGKGKAKKPTVKLRKTKSKVHKLGSSPASPSPGPSSKPLRSPDPLTTPPVFWTEVFSRADAKWLPVDPIRAIVNKRKVFDPAPQTTTPSSATPSASTSHPIFAAINAKPKVARQAVGVKQENRLLYVVAFEEDGFARDVTRRYAREFGAKVAKAQGGTSGVGERGGAKSRKMWWSQVVETVTRPYRLQRDDAEDDELDANELNEGMPSTVSGFKDHPLYVLTRHLKQNETIHPAPPQTPELGKFRGESVYPRSSVVSLKSAETWMRTEGRTIKPGSQPLKMVKMRAGTIGRQREVEILKERMVDERDDAGTGEGAATASDVMQGMYARSQTEMFVPPPVVNGKVPKNNFGNIDMYVPSMLPAGAVHIPFKGVAKIARKLGFDYGEAVTGFEFKKRRAFPVVEGIVTAVENETTILEAYWQAEQEAEAKARSQREKRVIKHWTRLIHGVLIRERLQKQYASNDKPAIEDAGNAQDDTFGPSATAAINETLEGDSHNAGGGFLVSADDVVERYKLPKDMLQIVASYPPSKPESVASTDAMDASFESADDHHQPIPYGLETMDVDEDDFAIESLAVAQNGGGVKTLQEMAEEDSVQWEGDGAAVPDDVEEIEMSAPIAGPSASTSKDVKANGKGTKKVGAGSRTQAPRKKTNGSTSTTNKRKRTTKPKRGQDGGSDSELSAVVSSAEEGDEDGYADVKSDDDVDDIPSRRSTRGGRLPSRTKKASVSPRKKPVPRTPKGKVSDVPVPPSTRVLRPRRSKAAVEDA